MNKIACILAVLLFAAPAWSAGVTITASNDVNVVTIEYDNSEPNNVRGFGLDIVCTNDVNIVIIDINDNHYQIYPGSIDINSTTGLVDANGSSVCYKSQYTSGTPGYNGTLLGPPDSNMTVEAGSLYEGGPSSPNAPPKQGWLVKFYVTGTGITCINVSGNAIRCGAGNDGVVMEDPNQSVAVTYEYEGCCIDLGTGCNQPCGLDTSGWQGYGIPDDCLGPEDIGYITDIIEEYPPYYYCCKPDPNYDECLDTSGWQGYGIPDDCLGPEDIGYIIDIIEEYPPYFYACNPDPNYINCDP